MYRSKQRYGAMDLLHKLADLPQEALQWVKGKAQTVAHEKKLLESAHRIELSPSSVEALKHRLSWILRKSGAAGRAEPLRHQAEDQAVVAAITRERDAHNQNNVSRTAAYLHMYREHPELHWAFLSHMVSRNGGWNMTDLQGDLLPYLLRERDREWVFGFLERANALIFRDAYPQLLLYRASLQAGKPLFHLLPAFGVSRFMRPVWELFWLHREPPLLTIGLIVNEQHFIEHRVVRHPLYRKRVLDRMFFQAQSLLQLNQVVFPYRDGDGTRLAGLILENFSSLQERIELGKKLYAVLFGIPIVLDGAQAFAYEKRHSGSRADYWPQLFSAVRYGAPVPRGQLKERLDGGRLRPGASPLYSPRLTDAWPDKELEAIEPGDWFHEPSVISYFHDIRAPFSFEMTHEFSFGLSKVEMAVLAGDLWK
ncbi:DUF2515 domain-containing protein [Paenibacillus filicis]|uniref:DUF2515 domain-containing protein n=1 Tax=Paenibacillus gyeongsangnamensis TaxID=3388067 RepID=A0ABT4QJ11_9BACL|nr:DUF2515 domain-containing protein [Paenibacillus filicis]MCZ8516772.1 DUF2515 domain-containing protein [Paenibacillus filicis]